MTDWDPCLFVALGASPVEAWLDELLDNPAAIRKAAERLAGELAEESSMIVSDGKTSMSKRSVPTETCKAETMPEPSFLRSPWRRRPKKRSAETAERVLDTVS